MTPSEQQIIDELRVAAAEWMARTERAAGRCAHCTDHGACAGGCAWAADELTRMAEEDGLLDHQDGPLGAANGVLPASDTKAMPVDGATTHESTGDE